MAENRQTAFHLVIQLPLPNTLVAPVTNLSLSSFSAPTLLYLYIRLGPLYLLA